MNESRRTVAVSLMLHRAVSKDFQRSKHFVDELLCVLFRRASELCSFWQIPDDFRETSIFCAEIHYGVIAMVGPRNGKTFRTLSR